MCEAVACFVGKECIITMLNKDIVGTIESISGNWIQVRSASEGAGTQESINLDYVNRIREYPRSKNGGKRRIVID